ncbi:hypothetical protein BHE74_00036646 [Ensete ventricosum]|nr:hypothetical protein BHE74_00036646 [Ensete ventricosum]
MDTHPTNEEQLGDQRRTMECSAPGPRRVTPSSPEPDTLISDGFMPIQILLVAGQEVVDDHSKGASIRQPVHRGRSTGAGKQEDHKRPHTELTEKDLSPIASTLTSFTGDFISPLGTTTLLVTIGHEPKSKIITVTYMVVDLPSTYNVILSCPTLNKLRAIISTYHRTMKFSTRARIGEVRSDPQEFRKCYLTTIMLPKKLKLELRLTNTMSKSRLDQFDARAKPCD